MIMDKIIYLPTAALSIVFILYYAISCHKNKKKFDQKIMINTVLQVSGVICGIVLIGSTFINELKELLENLNLYILIGGLAVGTVSVQGIYRDLFQ